MYCSVNSDVMNDPGDDVCNIKNSVQTKKLYSHTRKGENTISTGSINDTLINTTITEIEFVLHCKQ